jgi:TonB family protein
MNSACITTCDRRSTTRLILSAAFAIAVCGSASGADVSSGVYNFAAIDAKGVRHEAHGTSDKELPWTNDQLAAVGPNYPYLDRTLRHTGTGLFRITIDVQSGTVRNVTVLKSTGFKSLDSSTLASLRTWRWKPGTWKVVELPVTFTLVRQHRAESRNQKEQQTVIAPGAIPLTSLGQKYQPLISAPSPKPQKNAEGRYLAGSGFVLVELEWKTGAIKSVKLVKSSGYKKLDDSVMTTLRDWKFKPATTTPVKIPFTFKENGKVELGYRHGQEPRPSPLRRD